MRNQSPGHEDKFFAQMRKLKIVRQESKWIGGVAAGIAERFGIDVVLVRGVLVALSILGGLGLVLYGIAWALLPDTEDRIHLERAINKEWTSGMTGALITVVLGIFPAPWFLDSLAPILWPIAIVAAIVFLIFKRRNTKYDGSRPGATYRPAPEDSSPAGTTQHTTQGSGETLTGTVVEKTWRSENTSFSAQASVPGHEPAGADQFDFTQTSTSASEEHTMESEKPGPSGPQEGSASTSRPDADYTTPFEHQAYPPRPNPSKQAKEARRARLAPPVPGWIATTIVGLTVLVIAAVLSIDYLNVVELPGNGWSVALACGLLLVGLSLILVSATKRTSGGLLGLAIPLLVLTVIFGGSNLASGNQSMVHTDGSDHSYSAVFSNSTLDLTDKQDITSDTTVDVSSVFSKLELKLPDNVPVKIKSDGVFISDLEGQLPQDLRQLPADAPTLTVDIDGVFSSFESTVSTGPGNATNPQF